MEELGAIACLLIVAGTAGAAIFHPAFDDTLIQRICLAAFCIGALGAAWHVYQTDHASGSLLWGSAFAALYGLETWRCILFGKH